MVEYIIDNQQEVIKKADTIYVTAFFDIKLVNNYQLFRRFNIFN